jgi:starvation-inducible outer membrane lipoprotein
MRPKIFIPILLLFVVSCAPFPKQVMEEVKKDIAFSEVIKTPDAFKGETIIWGGVIIETITRTDDTLIMIRQTEPIFKNSRKNWTSQPAVSSFVIEGFSIRPFTARIAN